MTSSPPTRIDARVYEDAAIAAGTTDRSTAQQLSHWARIGREVEATAILTQRRRATAAADAGAESEDGVYDDLDADAQAQVRAGWDGRIAERTLEVDIAAERRAEGRGYVVLDDHGAVVRHHADGTVEPL